MSSISVLFSHFDSLYFKYDIAAESSLVRLRSEDVYFLLNSQTIYFTQIKYAHMISFEQCPVFNLTHTVHFASQYQTMTNVLFRPRKLATVSYVIWILKYLFFIEAVIFVFQNLWILASQVMYIVFKRQRLPKRKRLMRQVNIHIDRLLLNIYCITRKKRRANFTKFVSIKLKAKESTEKINVQHCRPSTRPLFLLGWATPLFAEHRLQQNNQIGSFKSQRYRWIRWAEHNQVNATKLFTTWQSISMKTRTTLRQEEKH